MYKNIMINSAEIFSRVKNTFEKLKTGSHPVPNDGEINVIINEMVQNNITDIPSLQTIEEFIEQYKDKNSNVYKIEHFFSGQKRIRHQQGRGELALYLLFPNSERTKHGDIKINNKEYELKKEIQTVSFAVKTYGKMNEVYSKIVELRSFIKTILCKYFSDSDAYKYFTKNFSKKISEFGGGDKEKDRKTPKLNDFLKFDYLISLIKNDAYINSIPEGKILIDIIGDFNTNDWKNEMCQSIIYSGGVLVLREKKMEYELYTDASHFFVKELTIGNVKIKII
jgi:hypothetical protein